MPERRCARCRNAVESSAVVTGLFCSHPRIGIAVRADDSCNYFEEAVQ